MRVSCLWHCCQQRGPHFTCFTGTKVKILTQKAVADCGVPSVYQRAAALPGWRREGQDPSDVRATVQRVVVRHCRRRPCRCSCLPCLAVLWHVQCHGRVCCWQVCLPAAWTRGASATLSLTYVQRMLTYADVFRTLAGWLDEWRIWNVKASYTSSLRSRTLVA